GEPSLATQRTFFVVAGSISSLPETNFPGSKVSGRPFSSETMFREALWPHIGQSPAKTAAGSATRIRSGRIEQRRTEIFISSTISESGRTVGWASFHFTRLKAGAVDTMDA